MNYPSFIKKNDSVFLVAPSSPTSENKVFFSAVKMLEKNNLQVCYDKKIFGDGVSIASADAKERVFDCLSAWNNKKSGAILAVAGGEFEMEILPFLKAKEFEKIQKWFVGFSDNTILHHFLLTHLDTASVYHYNLKYFGMKKLHNSVVDLMSFLKGNKQSFDSFKKFQLGQPIYDEEKNIVKFDINTKSYLTELTGKNEVKFSGRMIGGCMDVLKMFLGTKYDKTSDFLNKYKQDGFVWYLEDFNMDACEFKRVLWHMENNGWFKFVKGFVFGRSTTRKSCGDFTHENAILAQLSKFDVPLIFGADIGHIFPTIPVVNGSIGKVVYKKGKMNIEYKMI